MFPGQFYGKRLSIRERNMKLLLETVTYLPVKERAACLYNYNRNSHVHDALQKYQLHNCYRDSHLHNYSKNCHPHICCICNAEISNCIIANETVICIIVTERSTNRPVTESTTSKPA